MKHLRLYLIILTILPLPTAAQFPATQLVTQPVDTTKLVALHGSLHPLAQPRYDNGIVNESTPAERLLLVLNRPPEREAAFRQLLVDLHTPGSPSYHQWLTPVELGNSFGPADADLDAVTGWLTTSGFAVNRVSDGHRFVEFSGTVGQVNAAFHTQMHQYLVNGELHHANATEIRIPEALAQIVAGVSP
jgi:subtilase family serine protease